VLLVDRPVALLAAPQSGIATAAELVVRARAANLTLV
jgi:hypothetical protein